MKINPESLIHIKLQNVTFHAKKKKTLLGHGFTLLVNVGLEFLKNNLINRSYTWSYL